jgi:acyl-CoA thioesterase-1
MFARLLAFCGLLLCLGAAAAEPPTILVFGDSLSAAYGINVEHGWVALLRARLAQAGYPQRVVNASVSGETTSGGLKRLPAALDQHHPQIVLIELGANDGLRGQSTQLMRANLEQMIKLSRAHHARPVIFEMMVPANYGAGYGEQFRGVFHDVSKTLKVPMVPFWLAAFATDPKAFQDDGIHPTEVKQPQLLDAVWPTLRPLLKRWQR